MNEQELIALLQKVLATQGQEMVMQQLTTLLIGAGICLLASIGVFLVTLLLLRKIVLWYFRINELNQNLVRIERVLKRGFIELAENQQRYGEMPVMREVNDAQQ